jgi:CBS domain-containing protein
LRYYRKSIDELGLGTFDPLITITLNTKIIDAIELFIKHELSALPIVDENGILLDVYEKYDMMVKNI